MRSHSELTTILYNTVIYIAVLGYTYIYTRSLPDLLPEPHGTRQTPSIRYGTPFTPIYKYKLVQALEKPIQARYSLLYKSMPVYQIFSSRQFIYQIFFPALRPAFPLVYTRVYHQADSIKVHKFYQLLIDLIL